MAFSNARYTKYTQKITGFGMKDCLSLPAPGWDYFILLREEIGEPLFIHNDKCMRCFVRQRIKGGSVDASNQH